MAITNGNVNLSQIGIADYFAQTYKASLSQPMKPHPKMFQLTEAFTGISAANIVHVVDNMEKDIMGARQLSDLPVSARQYVDFIANKTGVPVSHISVGPGREQFITTL